MSAVAVVRTTLQSHILSNTLSKYSEGLEVLKDEVEEFKLQSFDEVEQLLRDMYTFFHHSSKCLVQLTEFSILWKWSPIVSCIHPKPVG